MRVQNEGTGKSSWWVLNPEAKPGKSPRRRATSMDTKEYAKKRGRVKRKVDQLRAAMEGAAVDGSTYSSGHDLADPFCLSPTEYRQRANSNASSLGGRLSPISSQYGEYDESIPEGTWNPTTLHDPNFSEISDTFAGMLMDDYGEASLQDSMVSSTGALLRQNTSPLHQQLSPSGYPDQNPSYLQVGGAYQRGSQQLSPQAACSRSSPSAGVHASLRKSPNGYHHSPSGLVNSAVGVGGMRHQRRNNFVHVPQSLTELLEQPDGYEESMDDSSPTPTQPQAPPPQPQPLSMPAPIPAPQLAPPIVTQQQARPNNAFMSSGASAPDAAAAAPPARSTTDGDGASMLLGGLSASNLTRQQRDMITTSLLRRVLTHDTPTAATSLPQQQHARFKELLQQPPQPNGVTAMSGGSMSGGSMQTQFNVGPAAGRTGSELEFLTDCVPADFSDCPDVDQIISHELNLGGGLDFNFDPNSQQAQPQQLQQTAATSSEQKFFNGTVQS